ncbi:MAG: acetate/propionate family kinase [Rhodospirillales bacterium]
MTGRASNVLALNSGSSSLKAGLYRVDAAATKRLLSAEAEAIGSGDGQFHAYDEHGDKLAGESCSISSQDDALECIKALFGRVGTPAPDIIGHRVVHGGPKLRQHCLIDDRVLRELQTATAFAPLHIPSALAVIGFAREHFPSLPQAACFDTAFHAGMPDVARVLALPREFERQGIQRYGFHGLSCESILHQLGPDAPPRLIIAHLGNGASVTAVKDGKSIDTSMGLTPTGGLIMSTRSGDLDPGVLVYLAREKKFDAAMLEELVDRRAGMLGISGVASDMRRLHEAAPSNDDATLAIAMFCYSVRKQLAAMAAALAGVDMIVFTAGIGEKDAQVRATICAGLSWMGVVVDDAANLAMRDPISTPTSRCTVRVLASQEDEQIARHSWELVHR